MLPAKYILSCTVASRRQISACLYKRRALSSCSIKNVANLVDDKTLISDKPIQSTSQDTETQEIVGTILNRIICDLRSKNYVLSLSEGKLNTMIAPLFQKLLFNGLPMEFLIAECSESDGLLKILLSEDQHQLFEVLELLTNYCLYTYKDGLLLLKSINYDLSHTGGAAGVAARLDVILNLSGVEFGQELGDTIRNCAPLIFAQEPEKIAEIFNELQSFFSKKQISKLVQFTPQILLMSFEELEQKYEYIFYQMGLEGEDFIGCKNWIEFDLENIMLRHQCLLKTGRYHFPDPKAPQLKNENPELYQILDSSDEHFSSKVAGITLEEWNIFKAIQKRAFEEADKDEPFVKVKPSMRKKLARIRKAAAAQPSEFVFGSESKNQF